MNKARRDELRAKHNPMSQNYGYIGEIDYCRGCKGPNSTLTIQYPCDAIEALDALDEILGSPELIVTDADGGHCLVCRHPATLLNGAWYCNH